MYNPMRILAAAVLLLGGAACSSGRPAPVDAERAGAVALTADLPFAELQVPPDNRPEGRAPPHEVPVLGPWRRVWGEDGTYETRLPVRPRALFFHRPPEGMALLDGQGVIPYGLDRERGWVWADQRLRVVRPSELGAPEPGELRVRYPFATQREAALNFRFSGIADPADFVHTSVQAGSTSYTGLLLPAPSVAAWDLTLPPSPELVFRPGLVLPETADAPPSDGATLVVEVEIDGRAQVAWSGAYSQPSFDQVRVDLSRWEGQPVRLRLRTETHRDPTFDYLFVAEPAVVSRKRQPRRVVLVFVDTLRPDHLGLYGYHRETSPALDALGAQAVVFDEARSVAPWTLPSARALVTGRQPERYDQGPTLQGLLRQQGWATAMFAGNVYLSANFDMHRDWGQHTIENWPPAATQVDRALSWLREQEGRDALLHLHLMDPHLPYEEPAAYRDLFTTTEAPEAIGERFLRGEVLRARLRDEADRQYVRDRYDNNIRYTDDQLARLYAALGPDDVLVFFSDHGEEFWERGQFEHGHHLFDELLRIPLVIRGPGLGPARLGEPASLLDVTPTVLDLLGVEPPPDLDGMSLLGAMQGDGAAQQALATRKLAFGRPLYGTERWGVLHEGQKWTTNEGREALYDLQADPAERNNLFREQEGDVGAPWRDTLAEAIGRPVPLGYRVAAGVARERPTEDLVVELHVPGGIAAAWVGDDPTRQSSAAVEVRGEVARIRWHAGFRGAREAYVIPARPPQEVTHDLQMKVPGGASAEVQSRVEPLPGRIRTPLARLNIDGRAVNLTFSMGPVPAEGAIALSGADAELLEMLQAMGYAVGDEDAPAEPSASVSEEPTGP